MSPWHATAPSSSEAKEHSIKISVTNTDAFTYTFKKSSAASFKPIIFDSIIKNKCQPCSFCYQKKVLSIRESELLNLFIYALHSYVYCCNFICAVEHFTAYVFRNVLG